MIVNQDSLDLSENVKFKFLTEFECLIHAKTAFDSNTFPLSAVFCARRGQGFGALGGSMVSIQGGVHASLVARASLVMNVPLNMPGALFVGLGDCLSEEWTRQRLCKDRKGVLMYPAPFS